jgi:hypothetical protein
MNASREHNEKGSTLQIGVHIWLKAASKEATIDSGNAWTGARKLELFLSFRQMI